MFLKAKMPWNILIPPNQLHSGLELQKTITVRLLEEFSKRKATKEHGYFVAVTRLDHLGDGKVRELTGDVLFPIEFSCITFKPFRGEILVGVVDKILRLGIFLNCGPIENIFLSAKTMGDYEHMEGDNPMFFSEKHEKMVKGTTVRFRVLGVAWMEAERSFQVLATLSGDYLGPV